jgi:hypothetical protein
MRWTDNDQKEAICDGWGIGPDQTTWNSECILAMNAHGNMYVSDDTARAHVIWRAVVFGDPLAKKALMYLNWSPTGSSSSWRPNGVCAAESKPVDELWRPYMSDLQSRMDKWGLKLDAVSERVENIESTHDVISSRVGCADKSINIQAKLIGEASERIDELGRALTQTIKELNAELNHERSRIAKLEEGVGKHASAIGETDRKLKEMGYVLLDVMW